jgi:hypothetical protein
MDTNPAGGPVLRFAGSGASSQSPLERLQTRDTDHATARLPGEGQRSTS